MADFFQVTAQIPAIRVRSAAGSIDVTGIAYDSRQVRAGDVFVAYRGFHTDGHAHIADALQRGAVAVIYEDPAFDTTLTVPAVRLDNARTALGFVAAALAGYPAQKLRVVGITGTDGKTTTTYLTALALDVAGRRS
jgi:UDP-N-acetylmuramoyl-L-alanyl-D-glutamate--2,6-diaminopimelate ligase